MNLKLPQILLALGFSSLAMADISSKCDASTAEFDTTDYPSRMAVQCGSELWWHLDLNQCFLNQDGTLYYYKDGNAFFSYTITDDNKQDILDLAGANGTFQHILTLEVGDCHANFMTSHKQGLTVNHPCFMTCPRRDGSRLGQVISGQVLV